MPHPTTGDMLLDPQAVYASAEEAATVWRGQYSQKQKARLEARQAHKQARKQAKEQAREQAREEVQQGRQGEWMVC